MLAHLILSLALAVFNSAPSLGLVQTVEPVHVAIVGAGAGGSSTAFFLRKFADDAGVAVNISLFETTDHIGGRVLSVDIFDDPSQRFELGASIFSDQNYIMHDACKEFGLAVRDPYQAESTMGIWDGKHFVLNINTDNMGWWDMFKMIWKYGIFAPRTTDKLTKEAVNKFLKLYTPEFFPFPSLTQRAHDLGLDGITGLTGAQFLAANKVSGRYAHDVVQASTRVCYASNLARIHGLETMVSMAPEGAVRVDGGNWKIFDAMAKHSGATISLNTSVVSIEHDSSSRYTLTAVATGREGRQTVPIKFDHVVIAAPYKYAGISAMNINEPAIEEVDYIDLHVTIFATPLLPSPAFFNLPEGEKVPSMILTTLGKDDEPTTGPGGSGTAGFFSITVLSNVTNPKTGKDEYLYKIFSPEEVTEEFLSKLFAHPMTVPLPSSPLSPISFYYTRFFHSYPRAFPRTTFQDPIVAAGLYYTSGMDSFISTMETNALMGKNVASLIVNDIVAKQGSEGQEGDVQVPMHLDSDGVESQMRFSEGIQDL